MCKSVLRRYHVPVVHLAADCAGLPGEEFERLLAALTALGLRPKELAPLAGDASTRRFFRLFMGEEITLVAVWYPPDSENAARRDVVVHRWARDQGLPVPELVAASGRVTVSRDLGPDDLSLSGADLGDELAELVLKTLAAYQSVAWAHAPNPPFDAAFFRAELGGFAAQVLSQAGGATPSVNAFLDDLAGRVASHPFRLVHRDFHANNLFLDRGSIWTVDFQDLRGGPDTYDLASLLRERCGGTLFPRSEEILGAAARQLGWPPGWSERFWECAAQRGLKVIATFQRLAATGRTSYLRFLPEALRETQVALGETGAPPELAAVLADMESGTGYHLG